MTTAPEPKLSALLASRGRDAESVAETLTQSLKGAPDGIEVVVIDQNPDQRLKPVTEAARERFPSTRFTYLAQEGQGLSRARNLGLAHAGAAWIILLDDDGWILSGSLEAALLAVSQATPECAGFYGEVFVRGTERPYIRRKIRTPELHFLNFDSACSVELILRRADVLEVGGFDERLGAGTELPAGEEADLILRLLERGKRILRCAEFRSDHPDFPADAARRRAYGSGVGAVYRKHLTGPGRAPLALKWALEVGFRAARGILLRSPGDREYLKGFLGREKKS